MNTKFLKKCSLEWIYDQSGNYSIIFNFIFLKLNNIYKFYFRYLRTKDEDRLTNPNLVYENVARFARAVDSLKWNGPIVAMTDCTKVRSKLTYSQELGCIVGSTMSFEDSHVDIYDDIHQIIKNIREKNEIASQVRCILLKVYFIVKLQFICYIVYLFIYFI